MQESLGRVPPPAALLVDAEIRHTVVVALVEVVSGRNAGLLRSLRVDGEDAAPVTNPSSTNGNNLDYARQGE